MLWSAPCRPCVFSREIDTAPVPPSAARWFKTLFFASSYLRTTHTGDMKNLPCRVHHFDNNVSLCIIILSASTKDERNGQKCMLVFGGGSIELGTKT